MCGRLFSMALCVALMALYGCQTTDDPRQGGLFSYNPEAYERRLAERQTRLQEVERQNITEQQRSGTLESEREQRRATRDSLLEDIRALDQEVLRAEKELAAFRGANEAAEKKRWELSVRLKSVKKQLAEVQANQNAGLDARQQEVERLRRTLDRLLTEAETLSKM